MEFRICHLRSTKYSLQGQEACAQWHATSISGSSFGLNLNLGGTVLQLRVGWLAYVVCIYTWGKRQSFRLIRIHRICRTWGIWYQSIRVTTFSSRIYLLKKPRQNRKIAKSNNRTIEQPNTLKTLKHTHAYAMGVGEGLLSCDPILKYLDIRIDFTWIEHTTTINDTERNKGIYYVYVRVGFYIVNTKM